MNVYDFDNTIYNGESTVDFFLFCLKKKKSLIFQLPKIIFCAILYKLRLLTQTTLLNVVGSMSKLFIQNSINMDDLTNEFWIKNKVKLKTNFLENLNQEDIIITATPFFIIEKIKKELKTEHIIASDFDYRTGVFKFLCYKDNKFIEFKKRYPTVKIKNFFTDSYNDKSIINISENAFLVKKDKITKIK